MPETFGHPIQSAATPITVRQLRQRDRQRIVSDPLEDLLWSYYDHVEAIGTYVSLLANAADLVSYFPAVQVDEGEPEPVSSGPAKELWDELGGEEWFSGWMSEFVRHLSVPGQAWLVPTRATDEDELADATARLSETKWQIWSTHELRRALNLGTTESIPKDDERIWRIYMPHPRDAKQADSAVRRVADKCEALVLLDRRRIADSRTRLFAGILPLPSRLRDEKTKSGKSFAELLEESMIAPINDPSSTAAVVPMFAFMEPEEIAALKEPVKMAIDDPSRLNEMEERLLRRIGIGIDAPAEMVLGIGDMNHWTGWLLEKTTYTQHLDPLLVRTLHSLAPWWKSLLESRGAPFEDQLLWRNPASALPTPDDYDHTLELWDRMLVKNEVMLAAADLTPDDAPDQTEIDARLEITTASQPAPEPPMEGPPASDNPAATIQAATTDALSKLASGLARVDDTLLVRVEREADKQTAREYRKLINRIAQAAKNAGVEVGDKQTLPRRLGPTRVQELIGVPTVDIDPIPFTAAILAAQEEAQKLTTPFGVDRNTDADEDDRESAVNLILVGLAAATIGGLFDSRSPLGEGSDSLVPMNEVRTALDTAGGGAAMRDGMTDSWALVGNGKRTVIDLRTAGITTEGFRWVYGSAPRAVFPPHLSLDGETFTRWDSPILDQGPSGSWIGGSTYYPADHKGCLCSAARILVEAPV